MAVNYDVTCSGEMNFIGEVSVGTMAYARVIKARLVLRGGLGRLQEIKKTVRGSLRLSGKIHRMAGKKLKGKIIPFGRARAPYHVTVKGTIAPAGGLTRGATFSRKVMGLLPMIGEAKRTAAFSRVLSGKIILSGGVRIAANQLYRAISILLTRIARIIIPVHRAGKKERTTNEL